MAGAAILCVEVDPSRIERRLATRYLDESTDSLDDALERIRRAAAEHRPLSVGLLGNAADIVPELARRGEHFDLVTDQTAAHDPLTGYIPVGLSVQDATALRSSVTWRRSSNTSGSAAMFSIMATTSEVRPVKVG